MHVLTSVMVWNECMQGFLVFCVCTCMICYWCLNLCYMVTYGLRRLFCQQKMTWKSEWPWLWKVRADGPRGLPVYDFLLVFNSSVCPNEAHLRDPAFNIWVALNDIELGFSRSLVLKSNSADGLPMYNFLLMYDSEHTSIFHLLAVMGTQFLVIRGKSHIKAGTGCNDS